jgi:dihydropyrimidinase
MIHCEDSSIIKFCESKLLAEGKIGARYYPHSRPNIAEATATARAIAIAQITAAPVYLVTVSCEDALALCRNARIKGFPVYVETAPSSNPAVEIERALTDPVGAPTLGSLHLRERG